MQRVKSKSTSRPPTRRERAKATRERVVEAAHRRFAADGYAATTMAAVAKDAGVAVQTVYFLFNTKAQLLAAVLDTTITGGAPSEGPLRPRELAQAGGRAWIEQIVDASASVSRRMAPLLGPFRAAAASDPDLLRMYRERVTRRRDAMRELARGAASRGELRRDIDPDRAGDILFALTGAELEELLVSVTGWSEQEWRAWVVDLLKAQLAR